MGNALTLQDPLLVMELLALLGCLAAMARLVLIGTLNNQLATRRTAYSRSEFLCVGTKISAPKKSLALGTMRICGK